MRYLNNFKIANVSLFFIIYNFLEKHRFYSKKYTNLINHKMVYLLIDFYYKLYFIFKDN